MRGRGPRRQGVLGWLGTLSGAYGIGIVAASAMLGAVITVVQRQDPGAVLGVLLVLGTVVAGFAVRTRSVRLVIPAPVFCYVPAAVIAGAINDRQEDTSKIGLVIHGGKWISSGFTAMTFATIVAVLITGVRLFIDYRQRPRRPRPTRPPANARSRGPVVVDRYQQGQGGDLDGLTRPMGKVGPAPTGPISNGPADGRGTGPRRPSPGSGGYPQPHPRQQGSGPYSQPPRPAQPGTGPYPPPGGYPPQRG